MQRLFFLAVVLGLFLAPRAVQADAFDNYTNDILVKIPTADGVNKVAGLTDTMLLDHTSVLPGIKPAFIVVKTNEGRFCKLLVQAVRQKLADKSVVPALLIERFVTYKEGEERTIVAEGKKMLLFADFQLNLDLGQIVPQGTGGDLVLTVKGDDIQVAPLRKAEIYLVTKHLPEANPKKVDKVVVGAKFDPKLFTGTYQLYDDGRRMGKLHLKINKEGDLVDSSYYSDKDGKKYEVSGKIGEPNHMLKFKIQLPQVLQEFHGWMFTGDARAITGFSRLNDREQGFYAIRIEKE
jgi:hypothetical protein